MARMLETNPTIAMIFLIYVFSVNKALAPESVPVVVSYCEKVSADLDMGILPTHDSIAMILAPGKKGPGLASKIAGDLPNSSSNAMDVILVHSLINPD